MVEEGLIPTFLLAEMGPGMERDGFRWVQKGLEDGGYTRLLGFLC